MTIIRGTKFTKSLEKIKQLIYKDDIEIFSKNEKKQETLKQTIAFNPDIEMEFSTEKCTTLIMKSGKRETTEEIELSNQESIRGKLQVPRNSGSGHYQIEIEEKNQKRAHQKDKKTPWKQAQHQKSHQSNKHLSSPPCNILWPILKKKIKEELRQKDQSRRKFTRPFIQKWHRLCQL